MTAIELHNLLVGHFPSVHVKALLRHFEEMVTHFQRGQWEDSLTKGGKFIEAALKALYMAAGQTPAKGKSFKVDAVINGLAQLPNGSVDDAVRLTMPRACRFAYDIASNRGRHDVDEINPSEMDANAVVTNCSWVIAEMLRHAQRGNAHNENVKNIVDSMTRKRYPLIEVVDGRPYFHKKGASGTEVALVMLFQKYRQRVAPEELVQLLMNNKFTEQNARQSVNRIKSYVDIDNAGRILLLRTGLEKAEAIMSKAVVELT